MARIEGVQPKNAGFFVRFAYFMTKRKVGRVVTPIRIEAHHPRLLRARAHMELGQEAAKTVDPRLKALAQVKGAMLVGCPF
jgi:4-carboxymuconolactone decarboxylase